MSSGSLGGSSGGQSNGGHSLPSSSGGAGPVGEVGSTSFTLNVGTSPFGLIALPGGVSVDNSPYYNTLYLPADSFYPVSPGSSGGGGGPV